MKKTIGILALLTLLISCGESNNREQTDTTTDNAMDAARNFVQAALEGNYEKAQAFMLPDSVNIQDLAAVKRLNEERLSPEEKKNLKEASIRIHATNNLNDSVSIIYYSNSYKNIKDSLKVIKSNNTWLVDFKYTMLHDDKVSEEGDNTP